MWINFKYMYYRMDWWMKMEMFLVNKSWTFSILRFFLSKPKSNSKIDFHQVRKCLDFSKHRRLRSHFKNSILSRTFTMSSVHSSITSLGCSVRMSIECEKKPKAIAKKFEITLSRWAYSKDGIFHWNLFTLDHFREWKKISR